MGKTPKNPLDCHAAARNQFIAKRTDVTFPPHCLSIAWDMDYLPAEAAELNKELQDISKRSKVLAAHGHQVLAPIGLEMIHLAYAAVTGCEDPKENFAILTGILPTLEDYVQEEGTNWEKIRKAQPDLEKDMERAGDAQMNYFYCGNCGGELYNMLVKCTGCAENDNGACRFCLLCYSDGTGWERSHVQDHHVKTASNVKVQFRHRPPNQMTDLLSEVSLALAEVCPSAKPKVDRGARICKWPTCCNRAECKGSTIRWGSPSGFGCPDMPEWVHKSAQTLFESYNSKEDFFVDWKKDSVNILKDLEPADDSSAQDFKDFITAWDSGKKTTKTNT
jgi:hypothetical protein